jgi:hypothetical protein
MHLERFRDFDVSIVLIIVYLISSCSWIYEQCYSYVQTLEANGLKSHLNNFSLFWNNGHKYVSRSSSPTFGMRIFVQTTPRIRHYALKSWQEIFLFNLVVLFNIFFCC